MHVRNVTLSILISAVFTPLLCVFAQTNSTESLTITTYYPAPYGVYGILRLNPRPKPGGCNEGEITYDSATATRGLYYCNSTPAWSQLIGGGGGAGYWLENQATHNIYNNNTGGKVGIGTQNPGSNLTVQSGALGAIIGDTLALQEIDSKVANNQFLRTFTRRTAAGNDWSTADLYLQKTIDISDMGFIKWPAGNWGIGFGSGTTEHMRITQGGNVGIGTLTPTKKLEVAGDILATGGDVCNSAGKCLNQITACATCPTGQLCRPSDWVPPGSTYVTTITYYSVCCLAPQICGYNCNPQGTTSCPVGSHPAAGSPITFRGGENPPYYFTNSVVVCVQ